MAVERVARAAGRYWTRDEERRLLELEERGLSPEEIAEELGRSASAVAKRAQYLREERDRRQICRRCAHYLPAQGECSEWYQAVSAESGCARFVPAKGVATGLIDATRDGGSIIWLKNERGNRRPRAQDQFLTLPPETSRGNCRLSTALGERFSPESERVAIGMVPPEQEIWLRRDPNGPFKVSRVTERRKARSIGGPALAERIRQAGLRPGRYYLDAVRSGDKLMVFVWREPADKRSRYL